MRLPTRSLTSCLLLTAAFLATSARSQGFGPTAEEEAKVVAALGAAPGKLIGEIGAGDGALSIKLGKIVATSGRVFATEMPDKRDALKKRVDDAGARNIEVIEAKAASTGLAKNCCDAVFMRDVYHHLTDPEAILADVKAALRPGGRLLIIDFEPRRDLPVLAGVRENRRGHGVPMEVLAEELKAAGFEIVTQDREWRSDLYAVIAKR